jgi:hypothetical protein
VRQPTRQRASCEVTHHHSIITSHHSSCNRRQRTQGSTPTGFIGETKVGQATLATYVAEEESLQSPHVLRPHTQGCHLDHRAQGRQLWQRAF